MLAGLAIGIGLSLWLGRFIEALLFNLQPRDPWTIAGAVAILAIVATLAALVPARRAARLDPAEVLREG